MAIRSFAKQHISRLSVTPRVMLAVITVLLASLVVGAILLNGYIDGRLSRSYTESVETLFYSLQEGVRGSLERGQMKNFQNILLRQKTIKGVVDVSLYDRTGHVNLSSSGQERFGIPLARELAKQISAQQGMVRVIGQDELRIVAAQRVEPDCVRCHPTWKEGEQGGVLSLTYDLSDLRSALERLRIYMAVGTLLLLLVVSSMIHLVMRRIVSMPINGIVEHLTRSSSLIASAADKASHASQSLSGSASQEAASLTQTSASLESISAVTASTAQNASAADRLMSEASQVFEGANQRMGELTAAMSQISRANDETRRIIKTIDAIAFQTNLLALNAAVEAARAGDAGAGFAVVANEVRSLAKRAAEAAHETTALLDGTQTKVATGVELVRLTGKSFGQAASQAQGTAALLREIAQASKDQAVSIQEVTTAVQELDEVTQQNAGDAEQAAHIAEQMQDQSAQLNGEVSSLLRLVRGEA